MALRNFRLGYLCLIAVFKKASVLKNQLKPLHYGKQLGGVSLGFGMYSAILSDENVKKGQKSGPIPLTKVQITRTVRELLRFQEFASLSVGEEFFMTPKDFLDAMTLTNPRPRMRRKRLSPEQASRWISKVPDRSIDDHSNTVFFRALGDEGLVTFQEYLFLKSVLTRPKNSFRFAFDVIDTSGEGQVNKEEFLRFCQVTTAFKAKEQVPSEIFSLNKNVGTTLKQYFFGSDGQHTVNFEQFSKYINDFQKEILMTEFQEFSMGHDKITATDFAEFLLRFANLTDEEFHQYLNRLRSLKNETSMRFTFEDLEKVNSLINNLNDFCIIARIFHLSGKTFSKDEFGRAARICLDGQELPKHVVKTIVCLFDKTEKGRLDYNEFVSVMRTRLRRRRRSSKDENIIRSFRRCVRRKLREAPCPHTESQRLRLDLAQPKRVQ